MAMQSLDDLFVHELKDVYDAEHQVINALPKMAQAANASDLQSAFEEHLEQSQGHIDRLKQIFELLERKPARETCAGMKGIIEEGQKALEEDMSDAVRDAALIAAAQRVEHYEMAGYGTLRTYAHLLGHADAAQLLQQILDEEEITDKKLSQLANSVNQAALGS
ncbi:MAG: ferritin-like domain-containing protein [Anaerolineae bacterium]|nr:ferritin-like domain-containing protein [Anaerolineae bacterium]MCA9909978.1 ferritin-like domain-containing protein [Anaerolineae bacterium]